MFWAVGTVFNFLYHASEYWTLVQHGFICFQAHWFSAVNYIYTWSYMYIQICYKPLIKQPVWMLYSSSVSRTCRRLYSWFSEVNFCPSASAILTTCFFYSVCLISFLLPYLVSFSQPKPMEVQVITHHMQRYAVWFGGSMLASTVNNAFPYCSLTVIWSCFSLLSS